MRSDREAKKILRAFGKALYEEHVRYVDSFSQEKVPYYRTISYRHTFRRVIIAALLAILVMALAVSVYAAVTHFLNYDVIVHDNNDEYVSNNEVIGGGEEIMFFEQRKVMIESKEVWS